MKRTWGLRLVKENEKWLPSAVYSGFLITFVATTNNWRVYGNKKECRILTYSNKMLWFGRPQSGDSGDSGRRRFKAWNTHLQIHNAIIDRIERMAIVIRCHPCGDGKHWCILEAGVQHPGMWRSDAPCGQCPPYQACSRAQDRQEGLRLDMQAASCRSSQRQFCSSQRDRKSVV